MDAQTLRSPDATGGIGHYLESLLLTWSETPEDIEGTVMKWGPEALPSGVSLREQRLTPDVMGAPQDPDQAFNAALRQAIRVSGASVLLNPNPLQPTVRFVARPSPVPLVATVHDLTPLHFTGDGKPAPKLPDTDPYMVRLRRLMEHADHIIADSDATRRDLVDLKFAEPERVSTVWLGADDIFHRPPSVASCRDLLGRLGLAPFADAFILMVGGWHTKRNGLRVLTALGQLSVAMQAASPLVITGAVDPLRLKLLRKAHASLCPAVPLVLPGHLLRSELAALMSQAAVLVYPSVHEGFGLPVVEAMAAGCPVITSHGGALPEVAGGAAVLCHASDASSIAEALLRVLSSPDERERRREHGRKRAHEFTWTNTAARTLAILRKVSEPRPMISRPEMPARLAWYSPVLPSHGGVSRYTASFLEALEGKADVAVVTPTLAPDALPHGSLHLKAAQGVVPPPEGMIPVYHMQNNTEQAEATYETLLRYPGLTVVHDLNIHPFLLDRHRQAEERTPLLARLGRFLPGRAQRRRYWREMEAAHGPTGGDEARDVILTGVFPDLHARPCHRLLTAASRALISHSHWGVRQLENNADAAPVYYLPLGIEHPIGVSPEAAHDFRSIVGATPGDLLIVCAGILGPGRRLDRVVSAAAHIRERGVSPVIAFVGAIGDDHADWLRSIAGYHGLTDRVSFHGEVDDQQFLASVVASDVIVHLQYPTNGQTSSTVLRALSAGRPVLVSDSDSFRELPDDCVWKVPANDAEIPVMVEYLEALGKNPTLRQTMGDNALNYIERDHCWPSVARRFLRILEDEPTWRTPPRPPYVLPRIAGRR